MTINDVNNEDSDETVALIEASTVNRKKPMEFRLYDLEVDSIKQCDLYAEMDDDCTDDIRSCLVYL